MMLRWIKKLFGIYETGYEYRFPVDRVVITPEFKRTRIGKRKWNQKKEYYLRTGKFESQVVLTKDFVLLDGYSTYKLAKRYGVNKIPVIFEEYLDEDGN